MFTGIGFIAFCFIFGGGVAGLLLGKILPESYRTEPTHKAVQLTMGSVGLLAALVLGLLVASAKNNFDTSNKEVEQFSASLILLDREIMNFGQDAKPIRDLLRGFTEEKFAQIWGQSVPVDHSRTVALLDDIQSRLRMLTSQNEVHREARSTALHYVDELKQNSRLLAVQEVSRTPRAFLMVMVFWLSMLFLSYALFAPANAIYVGALFVAAISLSVAVNLIVDMDHPFRGFIKVSPVPMQQALERMTP